MAHTLAALSGLTRYVAPVTTPVASAPAPPKLGGELLPESGGWLLTIAGGGLSAYDACRSGEKSFSHGTC